MLPQVLIPLEGYDPGLAAWYQLHCQGRGGLFPMLSLVPHLWQLQFRVTGGGRQAIGRHHCRVHLFPPFIDSLSTDQAILSQSGLWSNEHPEDQWYLIALEFKVPGIPQAASQAKVSSGQGIVQC